MVLLHLQNFLQDLLKQSNKDVEVTEEQLIVYADTMVIIRWFYCLPLSQGSIISDIKIIICSHHIEVFNVNLCIGKILKVL